MKSFRRIIKNCKKYNKKTKLARGLILDFNNKKDRFGGKGYSTSDFGAFWFASPKGYVLFKIGKNSNNFDTGNIQMLNEILCYRLAKRMNIPCAEYFSAQLKMSYNLSGIASVNFLKEGECLIPVGDMVRRSYIDSIMQELKAYDKQYKIDYDQIYYGLYTMSVFDLLTYQSDRHLFNVAFVEGKNNELTLAPLFDNEFSFFLSTYLIQSFNPDSYTLEEFINNYFTSINMVTIYKVEHKRKLLGFDVLAEQIASKAKEDPKCNEILKRILKNCDLRPIYKELEQEGYEVFGNYKEFTTELLDFSKDRLTKIYEKRLNSTSQQEQELER